MCKARCSITFGDVVPRMLSYLQTK